MARQFEEQLRSAWNALVEPEGGEGYSYLPLSKHALIECFAARRFPENKEAILISFPNLVELSGHELPSGLGFEMRKENTAHFVGKHDVYSVLSTEDGPSELFEAFAADILSALDPADYPSSKLIFSALISRLRSWQEFMKRARSKLMSIEEQTGLFGELVFIKNMLSQNEDPSGILKAWVGPLSKDQDFHIGTGAVEVKSTVSSEGFPASIQSIFQLDDSVRKPLFLGAVRLEVSELGGSLSTLIESMRGHFLEHGVSGRFRARLEQSGYFEEHADKYPRLLLVSNMRFLRVSNGFPRLTTASLSGVLLGARYKIDIDRIACDYFSFEEVMNTLRKQG